MTSTHKVVDGVFEFDLNAVIQNHIDNNQKVWAHDRSLTIGASEIFGCARQNFFKKRGKELGFEKDEDHVETWGATQRGDIIEAWIAPALGQALPKGAKLLYAGNDQKTLVLGRNSATPDGLFVNLPRKPMRIILGGKVLDLPDFHKTDGTLYLEIKSIDPRARLEEERTKHRGQCQVGLGIMRETTEYRPGYALIIYIDASFLNKITPFLITYDDKVWKSAKRRAPLIWEHDDPNAFEPEGKYTKDCDHCAFKKACGEAILSEWAATDANIKTSDDIIEAVREPVEEFLDKQAVFKIAERDLKEAQQRVKDALVAKNSRRVKGDEWSVSWTAQKGRTSVDYKRAFAKHGIDQKEYEVEGAGFDVLRVTPKKDDEDHGE